MQISQKKIFWLTGLEHDGKPAVSYNKFSLYYLQICGHWNVISKTRIEE